MSAKVPSAQTGASTATWMNGSPERYFDGGESAEQLDDPEQRHEERHDVQRAARRRQLQREGEEDLADAERQPLPRRQRARTDPRPARG